MPIKCLACYSSWVELTHEPDLAGAATWSHGQHVLSIQVTIGLYVTV
jgi:hypothetical protein